MIAPKIISGLEQTEGNMKAIELVFALIGALFVTATLIFVVFTTYALLIDLKLERRRASVAPDSVPP
jgi:hypothetical protein